MNINQALKAVSASLPAPNPFSQKNYGNPCPGISAGLDFHSGAVWYLQGSASDKLAQIQHASKTWEKEGTHWELWSCWPHRNKLWLNAVYLLCKDSTSLSRHSNNQCKWALTESRTAPIWLKIQLRGVKNYDYDVKKCTNFHKNAVKGIYISQENNHQLWNQQHLKFLQVTGIRI